MSNNVRPLFHNKSQEISPEKRVKTSRCMIQLRWELNNGANFQDKNSTRSTHDDCLWLGLHMEIGFYKCSDGEKQEKNRECQILTRDNEVSQVNGKKLFSMVSIDMFKQPNAGWMSDDDTWRVIQSLPVHERTVRAAASNRKIFTQQAAAKWEQLNSETFWLSWYEWSNRHFWIEFWSFVCAERITCGKAEGLMIINIYHSIHRSDLHLFFSKPFISINYEICFPLFVLLSFFPLLLIVVATTVVGWQWRRKLAKKSIEVSVYVSEEKTKNFYVRNRHQSMALLSDGYRVRNNFHVNLWLRMIASIKMKKWNICIEEI